jgi:hypothetical protein
MFLRNCHPMEVPVARGTAATGLEPIGRVMLAARRHRDGAGIGA